MDGEDILRMLSRSSDLDVVMISSQRNQKRKDELRKLGAKDFISKERFMHRLSPYYIQETFEAYLA